MTPLPDLSKESRLYVWLRPVHLEIYYFTTTPCLKNFHSPWEKQHVGNSPIAATSRKPSMTCIDLPYCSQIHLPDDRCVTHQKWGVVCWGRCCDRSGQTKCPVCLLGCSQMPRYPGHPQGGQKTPWKAKNKMGMMILHAQKIHFFNPTKCLCEEIQGSCFILFN